MLPNNRVETGTSFSEYTKSLFLNVSSGRWSMVANLVFKHPDLGESLLQLLSKTVSQEFQEYCADKQSSILTEITPSKLTQFSNEALIKEVEEPYPFWKSSLMEACCNTSNKVTLNTVQCTNRELNSIALASAVAAKTTNQKNRMSSILFHSGARSEEIDRLCELGVCMSHHSTV